MNQNSKRNFYIMISFALIIFGRFLPLPEGMKPAGMTVTGIFAGSLLLWLTVAIDWPSLLCIAAIGMIPGIGFKGVFFSSFGNETFAFLMCTFMCTYVLSETPFLKRCALYFITSPMAKKGPWMFIISFLTAIICIGCFVSPTVLFVVFLPILEKINEILGLKKGDKIGNMLMIGLTFAVSVSAGMTPIAHVFSIMAMGFYTTATGLTIGYAQYMAFAIPVGIICIVLLLLMFRFIMNPDMSQIKNIDISFLKNELKPMEKKEKTILAVFCLVVALWVLPSLLKEIFPAVTQISRMGTAMPPMLGIILYSIISFDGKPLLNFAEGMKKGVQWSSIIMAAGTLAIGSAMTNGNVGLADYLINVLSPILKDINPMLLVVAFTAWACIQTNFSSNMVTVTVVTTVAIPLVQATNGAISCPAVVAIIGMMSAYAFATPPAMPHVAMAIGSGWSDTSSVMKYGLIFMMFSIIVTVIVGYPIAAMLM